MTDKQEDIPSHDGFLDTIEDGKPIYLECQECGYRGLPPRQVCPDCGSRDLRRKDLSLEAEVVSFTEIHIPTPMFEGEAPFTVVIAEFPEGVRLTGQLRGTDNVEEGDRVRVGVEDHDDHRLVTFTPV
ncbi:MAG: OB-fold domain-containing protein [Halobacteria archaeon]|nr:OB-fold domain-containing protein [Halobacteria archaeon]